jgi:hypothetical protein
MTELVEGVLDELPVASLPDRYGVARSQIYNRIKALAIKTIKRNNKAYVNGDQIALLDRIHQLLQEDYTLETAAAETLGKPLGQSYETVGHYDLLPARGLSTEHSRETTGQLELLQILATALSNQQALPPANPLTRFEQLQAIADNDWRPSTKDLSEILGLSSPPGPSFERYGFRITKAGKNGAQTAWKVEKLPS